jgi:hypothetical protein
MSLRPGKIRRLIINLPPRYLKSPLASVAFPAWCLGHDPAAQILYVSYAQELADKLSRDCRPIAASDWYRRIFPTRLSPERRAVPEFETTAQGCRLATSVGGVLTGRGADLIIIDDSLKPEEALSETQRRVANEWFDHTLYSRRNDKLEGASVLFTHRLRESLPRGRDRGTISSATCWRRSLETALRADRRLLPGSSMPMRGTSGMLTGHGYKAGDFPTVAAAREAARGGAAARVARLDIREVW